MAWTYSDIAARARHQAIIDMIDAAGTPGVLKLGTAGMAAVLAVIPFALPCGTVTERQLLFDTSPALSVAAAITGVAVEASIEDGMGNIVITGMSVGVGSGDVRMTSNALAAGQAVPIIAASITTP